MNVISTVLEKTSTWFPFGGQHDTKSETARAAHRLAKDQNGVARSAQPVEVKWVKDDNPEARTSRNPDPHIRLYIYKTMDGTKDVYIRHDTPRTYGNEGPGAQGPHFNAGTNESKLRQHHDYGEKPNDKK